MPASAVRVTVSDSWGPPVNLGSTINSEAHEYGASISADGLSLFFNSRRPGGSGYDDIYVSSRATTDEPWGEPVNLGPKVNGPTDDAYASISTDGRLLFFTSRRAGGVGIADIWVTKRTKEGDWGSAINLGPTVNSPYWNGSPNLSADGSTFYFSSRRLGGVGGYDLWHVEIPPLSDSPSGQ